MAETLFGPFGTALQEKGRNLGVEGFDDPRRLLDVGEASNADVVARLAKDYFRAGAEHAVTPTYGASGDFLNGKLDPRDFQKILKRAAELVRGVTSLRVATHAVGPYHGVDTGFDRRTAETAYEEQFARVREALGDGVRILVEALSCSDDVRAALAAAFKSRVEVDLAVSVNREGNLYDGVDLRELVRILGPRSDRWALGINCSTFPATENALAKLNGDAGYVRIVYPNACDGDVAALDGSDANHSSCIHDRARNMAELVRRHPGLDLVGVCCGGTVEAVRALTQSVRA